MKVLSIKASGKVSTIKIMTQRDNEVALDDIKKLMTSRIGMVLANKISRLAYLYIMFVEKDAQTKQLPTNMAATVLLNDDVGLVRGDVILVRTNHFGSGAKFFTLDDSEIKAIVEKMSTLYGSKIELSDPR